jgi:hypothetical protein
VKGLEEIAMHLHANVSLWQREHDGTYIAELGGYTLRLTWQPEEPGKQRGFRWQAERDEHDTFKSEELHEEAELAMAQAEAFARKSLES